MGFPARADDTTFYQSTAIGGVIHQLKAIAKELVAQGLEQEAGTLGTTIDDLEWQYEDLIEKELIGEWPNGPRRPARTGTRRSDYSDRRARPATR